MQTSNLLHAVLRRGRDTAIAQGHPWIFSGSVASWSATPSVGAVVEVRSHDGRWLGRGLANPDADLAIRVFTHREDEPLDEALLLQRVERAVAQRKALGLFGDADASTNACRLIFSESDGLSGLVVDRYADLLVVQVLARVWIPYLPAVCERLQAIVGAKQVCVQCQEDDAAREHMIEEAARIRTAPPSAPVTFMENGLVFEWDAKQGQKTGFYLDQRENRRRVAAYAAGRSVLGAYCFTGAFEINLAQAGASEVVGIDSSAPALEQAKRHCALNGVNAPCEFIRGAVPEVLRRFRDARRSFDLIVLDPPRFVSSRNQLSKGLRAYKDINLLALKLLRPGGILASFSCSGLVSTESFQEAIRWASIDARREVILLDQLGQPADHPVHLSVPETRYLKGILAWAI